MTSSQRLTTANRSQEATRGTRKRRTAVTERLLQEWIAKHDGGMNARQIASHFKVDRRTVEKHLPAALESRRWRRVRDDIDRGELQDHLAKIRDAALTLRKSLDLPEYGVDRSWEWPDDPDGLPLAEMLREHYSSHQAWELLDDWKEHFDAYVSNSKLLETRTAAAVEKRGWSSDATAGLSHLALQRADGVADLAAGAYPVLQGIDWEPIVEELSKSDEAESVGQEWTELKRLQQQLADLLTEIAFKVRIPGECRFCAA